MKGSMNLSGSRSGSMASSMMEPSTPSTTCPMGTRLQDQCHGCPSTRRGKGVPKRQGFLTSFFQDSTRPLSKTATPSRWSQAGIPAHPLLAPPIMKMTIIILFALIRGRGGVSLLFMLLPLVSMSRPLFSR